MQENEKAWAPDPDGESEIRATFVAIAVGEPISVNGIDRDAARITFEEGDREGTMGRVPF
jgi:hypothetical protein